MGKWERVFLFPEISEQIVCTMENGCDEHPKLFHLDFNSFDTLLI